MYTCLENIIGITQSECSCIITGLESNDLGADWYKLSTSGLYMDKLDGMIPLQALGDSTDCENEMAQFYFDARQNAINQMADDLLAALQDRFRKDKKSYSGRIASNTSSSVINISSNYAGMKLSTVAMRGASIKITKINTMMNADATFDISIYKVENGAEEYELVETVPNMLSEANVKKENALTTPVVIDLSEYGADFYLLYQPSGFLPRSNGISCGCGGKETLLKNFLTIGGVYGNDLSLLPWFSNANNAMGISLEAEVGCNTYSLICAMYDSDENIAKVMAWAIRFKACASVLEKVFKSGQVNRYTMMQPEAVQGTRNNFNKEYANRIAWLASNADINLIGCYACNSSKVRKSGILV